MNLPNKLTISRILLTFVYIFFLFRSGVLSKYIALFLFITASLTDLYDGRIARKRNLITNFGKIMDPIADKILILASFIVFAKFGIIPAWMVVVVILREVIVTGIRLFVISKSIVLEAQREGKHKTVSQVVTVISILAYITLRETLIKFGAWNNSVEGASSFSIIVLMMVTVILTLYSGISFIWKNRRVLS